MLGNQLDETNLTVPHIMGLANKSFFLPRVVLSEPTKFANSVQFLAMLLVFDWP